MSDRRSSVLAAADRDGRQLPTRPAALDFWFDLASPYSYLSARRIETLAAQAKVTVRWRPLLLGAIFRQQGWETSPFNLYPAKGEHMWRDFARRAARQGLAPIRPANFPHNSLLAARVALVGLAEDWGRRFIASVFEQEFEQGAAIADPGVIAACVAEAGGSVAAALAQAESAECKAQLRAETEVATSAGIFGVPAFTVDAELFWGDDRLEDALLWATGLHPAPCSG